MKAQSGAFSEPRSRRRAVLVLEAAGAGLKPAPPRQADRSGGDGARFWMLRPLQGVEFFVALMTTAGLAARNWGFASGQLRFHERRQTAAERLGQTEPTRWRGRGGQMPGAIPRSAENI